MMNWNDHMSTGGWVFSILWTVIIVAILAAVIVWLVSALRDREARGTGRPPSAREILDRRLASGELTVEQHGEMRDAIAGGSAAAPGADRGPDS